MDDTLWDMDNSAGTLIGFHPVADFEQRELKDADVDNVAGVVSDLDAVARRTLEGAELAGEIANRPVTEYAMPTYPEWAKAQAAPSVSAMPKQPSTW